MYSLLIYAHFVKQCLQNLIILFHFRANDFLLHYFGKRFSHQWYEQIVSSWKSSQFSFFALNIYKYQISVVSSIFQGGVCGLAGKFPSRYISAVISGQALGGIFASTANVVIKYYLQSVYFLKLLS